MGFRGRHRNKRDDNEGPIFDALRALGFSVHPMDTPADALVGFRGRTYLVEVKGAKGKLTEPQKRFLSTWRGDHHILRSVDEAEKWAQSIRGEQSR